MECFCRLTETLLNRIILGVINVCCKYVGKFVFGGVAFKCLNSDSVYVCCLLSVL